MVYIPFVISFSNLMWHKPSFCLKNTLIRHQIYIHISLQNFLIHSYFFFKKVIFKTLHYFGYVLLYYLCKPNIYVVFFRYVFFYIVKFYKSYLYICWRYCKQIWCDFSFACKIKEWLQLHFLKSMVHMENATSKLESFVYRTNVLVLACQQRYLVFKRICWMNSFNLLYYII